MVEMRSLCLGLIGSSPERPCDDVGGVDPALRHPRCDASDFLDRPADQRRVGRVVFGGGAALALWRIVTIMAKASMTSETWRCHPCQERVSLWSRPSSRSEEQTPELQSIMRLQYDVFLLQKKKRI